MKLQAALFAAVLLAGCSQTPSQTETAAAESAQDMSMSEAEHRAMPSAEPASPSTPSAQEMQMSEAEHSAMQAGSAASSEVAGTMASASGTVESVDAKAGKITVAHGPVDALKWPAMTMGFKATPGQIASVRPGQQVQFEFTSEGMDATIRRIAPTK